MKKYLLFLLFPFLWLAACQKNGDLVPQPEFFEIRLTWLYTPDAEVSYSVDVEGERIKDSLVFNEGQKYANKLMPGASSGRKRIVLKVSGTDSTVLDTSVMVNGKADLMLLAVSPAERPSLLQGGAGGDEAGPTAPNRAKHRFYYSEPLLPDSVRMEIHVCDIGSRPFTIAPTPAGSLTVKRGAFSPYVELPMDVYGRNTLYLYRLLDARDGSVVQDIEFRHATRIDLAAGYSESFRSNRAGNDGLPPQKLMTAVFRWGGPEEPAARQNKFYDFILFGTER